MSVVNGVVVFRPSFTQFLSLIYSFKDYPRNSNNFQSRAFKYCTFMKRNVNSKTFKLPLVIKPEEDSRTDSEILETHLSLSAFLSSWRFYATSEREKKVLRKSQCVSTFAHMSDYECFSKLFITKFFAILHRIKKRKIFHSLGST